MSLKDAKTAKKRKHDDDGSDNDSGSDKGHSKAAARGKRQAASMKDFTDHHWVLLNKAATEVLLSHQTELFALCPELEPWRPKGRVANLTRSLTKSAQGGEEAAKQMAKDAKEADANGKKQKVKKTKKGDEGGEEGEE